MQPLIYCKPCTACLHTHSGKQLQGICRACLSSSSLARRLQGKQLVDSSRRTGLLLRLLPPIASQLLRLLPLRTCLLLLLHRLMLAAGTPQACNQILFCILPGVEFLAALTFACPSEPHAFYAVDIVYIMQYTVLCVEHKPHTHTHGICFPPYLLSH